MDPVQEENKRYFKVQAGEWVCEQVPLTQVAQQFGTPCYVYSKAALKAAWDAFAIPLENTAHQIHYAVKANSNLSILKILKDLGAGFDIVSAGELERILKIGGDPKKIVFSGVGKSVSELTLALSVGIGCINIESRAELLRLKSLSASHPEFNKPNIALRVNPDVAASNHPYIATGLKENKFGIHFQDAISLCTEAAQSSHLNLVGLAFHIGSQITSLDPFIQALEKMLQLIDTLQQDHGITISQLDVGGGLGIRYDTEMPPSPLEYVNAILHCVGQRPLKLVFEPGRAIVAHAGILLTRVEYLKEQFAIVDASMNDLIRPALYGAFQEIVPVKPHEEGEHRTYDIVGPVCETSDFLGKGRNLCLAEGDLLAVLSAGAYGFSMSSNYNTRPRAAEILIDGDHQQLIRRREVLSDLFASEQII